MVGVLPAPHGRRSLPLTSHKRCQPDRLAAGGESAATLNRRSSANRHDPGSSCVGNPRSGRARSVDVRGRGRDLISRQTGSHRAGRQETKASRRHRRRSCRMGGEVDIEIDADAVDRANRRVRDAGGRSENVKRRVNAAAAGAATGLVGVAGVSAQLACWTSREVPWWRRRRRRGHRLRRQRWGRYVFGQWRRGLIADVNSGGNAGNAIGVGDTGRLGRGRRWRRREPDRPEYHGQRRHRHRGRLRRRLQPRLRQLAPFAERRIPVAPDPLSTARGRLSGRYR